MQLTLGKIHANNPGDIVKQQERCNSNWPFLVTKESFMYWNWTQFQLNYWLNGPHGNTLTTQAIAKMIACSLQSDKTPCQNCYMERYRWHLHRILTLMCRNLWYKKVFHNSTKTFGLQSVFPTNYVRAISGGPKLMGTAKQYLIWNEAYSTRWKLYLTLPKWPKTRD